MLLSKAMLDWHNPHRVKNARFRIKTNFWKNCCSLLRTLMGTAAVKHTVLESSINYNWDEKVSVIRLRSQVLLFRQRPLSHPAEGSRNPVNFFSLRRFVVIGRKVALPGVGRKHVRARRQVPSALQRRHRHRQRQQCRRQCRHYQHHQQRCLQRGHGWWQWRQHCSTTATAATAAATKKKTLQRNWMLRGWTRER